MGFRWKQEVTYGIQVAFKHKQRCITGETCSNLDIFHAYYTLIAQFNHTNYMYSAV